MKYKQIELIYSSAAGHKYVAAKKLNFQTALLLMKHLVRSGNSVTIIPHIADKPAFCGNMTAVIFNQVES